MSSMPVPPEPRDPVDPQTDSHASRQPRPSVMLSATIEGFGGGAPSRHRVRDLSAGGMRIDQAGGIQVGSTVLVTVGALQAVGATVVWVKDGSAGLSFAEVINPDDAKAKVAVAPKPAAPPTDRSPKAGWTYDLRNPYRRER